MTEATMSAHTAGQITTDVDRAGTPPSSTTWGRECLKASSRRGPTVLVRPWLMVYGMKAPSLGPDQALEGSSESLSRIPGIQGLIGSKERALHPINHQPRQHQNCRHTARG